MTAKHKQDFLYKPETPIIYKLWKGLSFDCSTIKENLIEVNPATGTVLNETSTIVFSFSDSTKFFNLSSNQSGFIANIKFKTQHKPAGHQAAADPWVDNEPANI